jgi:hypothetical protein
MSHLNGFDIQFLANLASDSLDLIEYEDKPFKKHLLALKSVI